MRSLFWLSFCDPDKPEGQQFLGASIVPGESVIEAVRAAHRLGCNPGGEVMGIAVPSDLAATVREEQVGKLMSRAEIDALGW